MAKPTTSGFTISGLLDRSASIRNDYPVERIPIEEIADHPANAAYSMDEAGIAQLAKSIARAETPELGQRIVDAIKWYEDYIISIGVDIMRCF